MMKNINDIKILVVGDIMLDKYTEGEVKRISPEAPVPIVNIIKEYHTLGGCGNVVNNLRSLGVCVDCVASIGPDLNGDHIRDHLYNIGVPYNTLVSYSKTTTVKQRIISDERQVQMLRIDREDTSQIDYNILIKVLKKLDIKSYDIIIVSDYAKGIVTSGLMMALKSTKKKIIVDPKPVHSYYYNGVYMITPNLKEWQEMQMLSNNNYKETFVLVTKGKDGMTLISGGNNAEIKGEPVNVYNVSGAGDTVVAVMATCISMGYDELYSAQIANKCAGYVVTESGTTPINKNKFIEYIN